MTSKTTTELMQSQAELSFAIARLTGLVLGSANNSDKMIATHLYETLIDIHTKYPILASAELIKQINTKLALL